MLELTLIHERPSHLGLIVRFRKSWPDRLPTIFSYRYRTPEEISIVHSLLDSFPSNDSKMYALLYFRSNSNKIRYLANLILHGEVYKVHR